MSAPPSVLRLKLRHAGYDPLPTKGKEPHVTGWPDLVKVSDADIRKWDSEYSDHCNTGVNGRRCPGLDIDLSNQEAAEAIEQLAHERFEEHGVILVRIGRAPRLLIPLRTDEPFDKTKRLFVPANAIHPITEKDCHAIEVLADGAQWIAYGVHPDTGKPYRWPRGELTSTKREDLPYVRAEDIEQFLNEAAQLLVGEFGYTLWTPPQTNGAQRQRRLDSKFGELNERAIANLDKWVPKLFPTATRTIAGGYRVKSADLGRGLEEDLSLDPRGIKYFGVHDMGDERGGRRTPVDVVMEWNHAEFADAVNWLERTLNGGGNPQQTEDTAENGKADCHDQAGAKQSRGNDQTKRHRFTLKPFDAIKVSTVPSYRIKGVFPRNGLVVVWGPPKCGKSFWTFDAVMHVAIGREYRGRRVQQGVVVYCALEGGSGFAGRIEAWRQRHLDGYDQPVAFYLIDVTLDLVADHRELITAIRDQIGNEAPAVVTIDTLNRAISGDENKSDDMSKFIRAADAVREAFNCLVLIVHHCGIVANRPRGHTSLAGADDAQIAVERNKDGVLTATVEHAKDFEAGAKLACKLERVELGNDVEGDELSSCIIVPVDAAAGAAGPKLKSKASALALSLLKKLLTDGGEDAPAALNLPSGLRVVKALAWRETFYATYPADKQDTKQKAYVRAYLDLVDGKLIGFLNEFVWLNPDKPDKTGF